ncbi:MAG: hypothetical protein ACE5DT_05905 [Nitrosopumilus sp.]
MPVKIRYKFQEDEKFYTCTVTYGQYQNFSKLPIVKECEIIKEELKDFDEIKNEMQKALDLAAKNDTSHIKKLSEAV